MENQKWEKIDSAGEEELADRLALNKTMEVDKMLRDADKYSPELVAKIKNDIFGIFDREYFKFLNKIDKIKEEKGVRYVREVEEFLKIDIKRIEQYIDSRISELLNHMNVLIDNNNVKLIARNSFTDIFGNFITQGGASGIIWMLDNFDSQDEAKKKKIANPNFYKKAFAKNFFKKLFEPSGMSYYVNELCGDNNKLRMELEYRSGYLQKFESFFNMNKEKVCGSETCLYDKNYPTGGNKLPYFRFFSMLEKGEITVANIGEELEKFDDKIVDKTAIKKSELVKENKQG